MAQPYLTGVKPVYIFCLTGACKRQSSGFIRQFSGGLVRRVFGGFNWGGEITNEKRCNELKTARQDGF
jgi:hypothetical protein